MSDTVSKRGFPIQPKFQVGEKVQFTDYKGITHVGVVRVIKPYGMAGCFMVQVGTAYAIPHESEMTGELK